MLETYKSFFKHFIYYIVQVLYGLIVTLPLIVLITHSLITNTTPPVYTIIGIFILLGLWYPIPEWFREGRKRYSSFGGYYIDSEKISGMIILCIFAVLLAFAWIIAPFIGYLIGTHIAGNEPTIFGVILWVFINILWAPFAIYIINKYFT